MNNADSVTVTRPSRRRQETTATRLGAWLFFFFSFVFSPWIVKVIPARLAAGHVTRSETLPHLTAQSSSSSSSSSFFFLPTVFCVECACLCLRSRTLDFWLLDIASASVRGPLCGSFPAPNRLPISLPTLVRLVQVRWNETPSKPRVSLSLYAHTGEDLTMTHYSTLQHLRRWLTEFSFSLAGENASLL